MRRLPAALLQLAILLSSIALIRCGSGTTAVLSPSPSDNRCSVALQGGSGRIPASGGSGTVSIDVERECQWTIRASANWLSFTSATNGQGPAQITYTVQANRSTSPRSQDVVVSDQKVVVAQDAAVCAFSVAPNSLTVPATGGDARTTVSTEDFCSWTASTQTPWLTIEAGASGSGTGEIVVRSGANTGTQARTGSIQVAGAQIAVTQAAPAVVPPNPVPPNPVPPNPVPPGPQPPNPPPPSPPCTFAASPNRFDNLANTAATLQVNVATQAGCTWTASSTASWITIGDGSKGSGNSVVELSLRANTGAARATTLTIAGISVPVSQRATCAYAIKPTSYSAAAGGGTIQVAITTDPGCAWSVSRTTSWARANPTSGSGSANVSVVVDPNTGAGRTVTLAIAGEDFPITQAAAACTYTVNPAVFDVTQDAQTKQLSVTTQSQCPVAATSSVSWVDLKSVPSSGSGSITVDIKKNMGNARSGNVTVTGQGFSRVVAVNQEKGN